MDYKEIHDYILNLDRKIVISAGSVDIINYQIRVAPHSFVYIILGCASDKDIEIELDYMEADLVDGEYEFTSLFRWEDSSETERGYLSLEHIEFKLIQTIKQRNRQEKLDILDFF
jgi:hypothetical protein